MKVFFKEIYYQESPLYEVVNEDGIGTDWCYLIVAKTEQGNFTHHKTFERFEENAAKAFVNKVSRRSFIDTDFWSEGTAWDKYATPQTYEEEKAEAIFNELN